MNYYEIGQRVRKFRKAHRLSQEELAERVGISTTHMSHIETGSTKLSLPVLVALAEELNTGTDELLFKEPERRCNAAKQEILSLLDGCSAAELGVLNDILWAAKKAMDKYVSAK